MLSHESGKMESSRSASASEPLRLIRSDREVGTLAPPPALTDTPDATALWKGFRRRWAVALLLGVVMATAAVAAVWFLYPSRGTAFSILQVASTRPTFTLENLARYDFPTYMKTQASRIRSRDVLMRTLNQDAVRGLYSVRKFPDTLSTLTWLEENLKVEYQEGSELLTASIAGEDSGELVTMMNALTKSYLAIINSQERTQRRDRVKKMESLYQTAKEKLSEKVAAREALAKGQGVKDAASMLAHQQNLLSALGKAQDQFFQIQYELEKRSLKLANLQANKKSIEGFTLPENSIREAQEADPLFKQDVMTVYQLQKLADRMVAEGHPPSDSTLVQTRRKLDALQAQVQARAKEIRADLVDRIRARGESDINNQIALLQSELIPMENQAKKIQDRIDSLTKETEVAAHTTSRDAILSGEIDQEEHNLAQLHQQLKNFQLEEESEARITPVGEAEWQKRDYRKRIAFLFMAPFGAFCLAGLAVAWWESRARRIYTPDEVSTGLGMRVVGTVPVLPMNNDKNALNKQGQTVGHNLVESIDGIRTMLLRTARTNLTRTVMVTSAVNGEGKTTLASNLAVSLARAGRKTLLMDCDLRSPAVHQLFEEPLQPGFSEALLGEVSLAESIRKTTDPNLWVLPAGNWDREVIQEMAKNGMESLMERLRDEFEFLIIDSHPVLAANDSLLIGQNVDLVIFAVMHELSQAPQVFAAQQKLATLGIEVFGAVVNGMPVREWLHTQPAAVPQAVTN